eukprot:g12520.t1
MSGEMSNTPSAIDARFRAELANDLKAEAGRIGFDLVGIAPAVSPEGFADFQKWLSEGHAGEMNYLPAREEAYRHPEHVLESVKSVVMLAANYCADGRADRENANATEQESSGKEEFVPARVARYAQGNSDYHDILKQKLRELGDLLHARVPGCRTRGVVDTAPLLERDFARLAGLGWFGKNTMLINKKLGSWLFLAALLTDVELPADAPHDTAHCGTCTRCLDACPTDAFPEPYVLDARKCISYLNIELRSPIPAELREEVGDWLFGCDICQDVCPWNRKAPATGEPAFQPLPELTPVDAARLLQLDEAEFRARFRHTPLSRPKRAGLLRNAAIVLGNSGSSAAVDVLSAALNDHEPLRIVALTHADPELELEAALEFDGSPYIGKDAGEVAAIGHVDVPIQTELGERVDVVIDFSSPEGLVKIADACGERGIALVAATTGLTSDQQNAVLAASQNAPVILAPNMSLAVNLTMKLVREAARALRSSPGGVDVEIIERHHRFKEDAPSGTALKFGEIVAEEMGQTEHIHGRHGRPGVRPRDEIGYHSLRTGDNVGEHTIVFGMMGETIDLTVRGQTRDSYAYGALAAAKFLATQKPGLYSMADVLGL